MKHAIRLNRPVTLIITDGAGTLFDQGSNVPAYAFQHSFEKLGIDAPLNVIMKYMGRPKKEHIRLLLEEKSISEQWADKFHRQAQEGDIDRLYESFRQDLYPSAAKTQEIPGCKEAAYQLKEEGIPLVMTTGYDRRMVEETTKVLPWLDEVLSASFTSSDVAKGRPAPDLIHRAMWSQDLYDQSRCVKAGDTLVDMQAADNARMPGVIVLSGSVDKPHAIDQQCGRKHLHAHSLAELIDYVLDGSIHDRFKEL